MPSPAPTEIPKSSPQTPAAWMTVMSEPPQLSWSDSGTADAALLDILFGSAGRMGSLPFGADLDPMTPLFRACGPAPDERC